MMDPLFRVELLNRYELPQRMIWRDMHQCYSDEFVADQNAPSEEEAGRLIVKHLLKGGRGHYGPLENPQISFNVGWFPHSTMQQMRTHRVGVHFSVQSFRYTGGQFLSAYDQIGMLDLDSEDRDIIQKLFYIRPEGDYTDRQGKRYTVTTEQREEDIEWCWEAIRHYRNRVFRDGYSEEHARGMIPFDVRQHWVMSANVRSLMHILDLRAKADAQLEAQQLCELIWPHFEEWVPQIAEWYKENRWKKAKLAP